MQRSMFPTSITTLDGARRVPTQAELDHMLYELVRDKLTPDDPDEPERTVPTEAELRQGPRAGHTRPAGTRGNGRTVPRRHAQPAQQGMRHASGERGRWKSKSLALKDRRVASCVERSSD